MPDFNETCILSTDFSESPTVKFHENLSNERLVVQCRRTGRHDEASSRFSQICERAQKRSTWNMRCPPVDLRDHVTKWANNKHAELDYKKTTTFNPPIYFNHTHMTHFPSNTQSGINWLGTMELYRNLCFHGMIILLHLDPTANGCSDTSFQNVFGIFLVPTGIDCIEVSDLSPPRRGSIIHF